MIASRAVEKRFQVGGGLKHGPVRRLNTAPVPPAVTVTEYTADPTVVPRKVLAKFPTRARPEKFLACLKTWVTLLSGRHAVEFLVSVDEDDDETIAALDRARDVVGAAAALTVVVGHSENKVHAVNRDIAGREFDVLIVISDDMAPQVRGWDAMIVEDMVREFPGLDGLVHYTDGYRRDICTLPVMGRALYERWGYIYHPDYRSLWCDNEQTAVAKLQGRYHFNPRVLARHEHPANTRDVRDALYVRNDGFFKTDREIYFRRRAAGFPREVVPAPAPAPPSPASVPAGDKPVLSLLIPTVTARAALLEELLTELRRQIRNDPRVEIRTLLDDGTLSVGAKRNKLVEEARGVYIAFVDDDDMIDPSYVDSLLAGATTGADCVTFDGEITTDGQNPKLFRFSLDLDDRTVAWGYERRPNHLCAIRRDIAQKVSFPEKNFGEDAAWSAKLRPLLASQHRIDKILYHYRYSSNGSLTHKRGAPRPAPTPPTPPPPPPPRGIQRRHRRA